MLILNRFTVGLNVPTFYFQPRNLTPAWWNRVIMVANVKVKKSLRITDVNATQCGRELIAKLKVHFSTKPTCTRYPIYILLTTFILSLIIWEFKWKSNLWDTFHEKKNPKNNRHPKKASFQETKMFHFLFTTKGEVWVLHVSVSIIKLLQ